MQSQIATQKITPRRNRNVTFTIRATPEEKDFIMAKMEKSGLSNFNLFALTMLIRSIIRSFTAFPIVIISPPNQKELAILCQSTSNLLTSFELIKLDVAIIINSIWLVLKGRCPCLKRIGVCCFAKQSGWRRSAAELSVSGVGSIGWSSRGVSLSDPKMLKAYGRFMKVATEWQTLEAEHLKLRIKFENK